MKVVCIKIPPTFATIKLEVGEIFVAFEDLTFSRVQKAATNAEASVQSNINKNVDKYWYVTDRLGNVIPCDFEVGKYFITLEEWRRIQLKELGI